MKTTVERLDDLKVKLTIEIGPKRVKKALDEAARHVGQGVNLPGFRKGKAPRRLLEAHVGKGAIVQHAMEDHLGDFYAEALKTEDIVPVGQPEIDVKSFDEGVGAVFEATVEVRPDFDPPEHEGIELTHPDWDVEMVEVEQQIEQLRDRFAELEEVERPADTGDYVTIDLEVKVGGEVLESAAVEDALYEIGSGGVTPKLDTELIGVVAGSDLTYTDDLPAEYPEHGGEEAEFTVTVKDVREKNLPPLDDDFAATASEFDTIDELREDIRLNLLRRTVSQAREELRGRILEAYLARVDLPLPEGMVENERLFRIERLEQQAEQFGIEAAELLQMQGSTMEDYERTAAEQATAAVKAQLVLDELAKRLDVEVSGDDLDAEIMRHATNHGISPQQVAEVIRKQGSGGALVGDIVRRKAINAIVDAAVVENAPPESLLIELGIKPDPEAEAEGPMDEDAELQAAGAVEDAPA